MGITTNRVVRGNGRITVNRVESDGLPAVVVERIEGYKTHTTYRTVYRLEPLPDGGGEACRVTRYRNGKRWGVSYLPTPNVVESICGQAKIRTAALHVLSARIAGRSLAEAGEGSGRRRGVTKQATSASEQATLAALGVPATFLSSLQANAYHARLERGDAARVTRGELTVWDPDLPSKAPSRRRSDLERAEDALDELGARMLKEAERSGGKLPVARQRHYRAESERLQRHVRQVRTESN